MKDAIPSNNALIAGLMRQDQADFNIFFKRNRQWIYDRAVYILKSHEDAEEVVNDVFMKVWKSMPSYDNREGRFNPWLRTIVKNTALDQHRKRNAASYQPLASEAQMRVFIETTEDTSRDPLSEMIVDESLDAIYDALCDLPVTAYRQRIAFILFHLEGYKHKQIARILNCTERASKLAVVHCKQKLKVLLNGH